MKTSDPNASNPDYENKNIYLKKDGDILGLHAYGDSTETGWQQIEGWCNAYSNDFKFLGSIYRISRPIEDEAQELMEDGWISIERKT